MFEIRDSDWLCDKVASITTADKPVYLYFGLLFEGYIAIFVGVSNDKILFFQDQESCSAYYFCEPSYKLFIHETVITLLWHVKNFAQKR